ncbi:MAG: hypothetical protein U0168_17065 [Nannocystaceae bacterium]
MLASLLALALSSWGPPVLPEPSVVDATPPPVQRPGSADATATATTAAATTHTADPFVGPPGEPAVAVAPAAIEPPAPAIAPAPTAPPPPLAELDDVATLGPQRVPAGWVRVGAPRWRGSGLLATGASLFAMMGLFQIGDAVLCGGCAIGGIEHAFAAGSLAFVGAGGHVRGGHDAFADAVARRSRSVRTARLAGAALLAGGVLLGIANDVMWYRCVMSGGGPFGSDGNCRYGLSRGLMDLSVAAAGSGLALTTWGARYRRDRDAYALGRVIAAPTLHRGGAGLTLGMRF